MKNIVIKNGLLLTASLIGYFLIMKLFGFHYHTELRIFNAVLVIYFVHKSISEYYHNINDNDYISAFFTGIITNAIAVIIFSVLAPFYLMYDPEFLNILGSDGLWGNQLNINRIIMILLMEGIPSGMIVSFVIMQYYKTKPVIS